MTLLVFPAEAVTLPDVDEAVFTLGPRAGGGDDLDVFFEAGILAGGVGAGRGLAEQAAQVDEMLLAGRPFGQPGPRPFFDESLG